MKIATLGIVLGLLLAGCAEPTDTTKDDPAPVEGMVIRGIVQTTDLAPVQANVTVTPMNLTEITAPDGSFEFPPLPLDLYTVTVSAPGYATRNMTVPLGSNETLLVTIQALQATPRQETLRYKGHLQCAAEYIIIAGSCDRASTEFGGPSVTSAEGIFEHPLPADWASVVVDVVFDASATSTYDGLRITVKGSDASDALNEYDQYGRFHNSAAYTFRIEPGQEYADGDGPVDANATALIFDVFAQGHGWHAACDPTGSNGCFLGVGVGVDVQFELVVTTFTIERAPEGFSLR